MTRITLNDPVIVQLGQACGPVELFDVQGRLIGHFTPVAQRNSPHDHCPYSDDEVAEHQRRAAQGGKKLQQMLTDLGYPQ